MSLHSSRESRVLFRPLFQYIKRCTSSAPEPDFYANIRKNIEENNKILRKHSYSHLKARGASVYNSNLQIAMHNAQKKMVTEPVNSIANIPAFVSIEILGNGTTHLRACVIIRTPLKTYMFNCPEGASRFLPQLRLKSLSVNDIFITRPVWDNIAGISSILLSKESNALPTRIHGAVNIKHFLECIRPFQDSDYGSEKYPSQVEERSYSDQMYEDAGLKVFYIPLSPSIEEHSNLKNNMEIAYIIELKAPARRIDPRKLMSMKVPKGPLIGKLKNGEAIVLPSGEKVQPEDVFADEEANIDRSRLLIVDCSSEAHVRALLDNSLFLEMAPKLDYIFHLSRPEIVSLNLYQKVSEASSSKCEHIIVNEASPEVPGVESIYRNHRILNTVCPSVFPPLYPFEWKGLISQNSELQTTEGMFKFAAPLQRFWMRQGGNDEPIIIDLNNAKVEISEKAQKLVDQLKTEASELNLDCEFPRISFLGTSSAVPSKYRNVSAYFVEASKDSALMIDVGEGSYGQLRCLFGKEGVQKMLTKLNAVLVTHAHQDHMNGLYTIIQRRIEAFNQLGLKYIPLVLVANRNVLKPLKTYSMCFEDLNDYLSIVDISRHPVTPPASPGGPPNKRRRLPSPIHSATRDILEMMPQDIFSKDRWNLHELKAVQVHHTRMANGFVLNIGGKRVVFSGDTKPCDLLVEEGRDADVLVHEATFEDGHEKDAMRKKHSTMGQAIDIGERMNAKHIILTHFSARYPKVPALPAYLEQKGNVSVAMDNLSVRFDHLPLLPKLIPIYREIYQEELFEIELRKEQRVLREKDEKSNEKSGGAQRVKV